MKNAALITGFFLVLAISLTIFISVMTGGCGQEWFPKCDDPKHPCTPIEPDYPPMRARDAGKDR